jgi:protoporphyrinogen oxidase
MRLVSETTLDELPALAAGDPGRLIDFLDRQWSMVAVRACDLVGSAVDHHVQHVLPQNEGFLVHRENPFVSTPSNIES